MCTVLTYRSGDLYYGRTLDYHRSFGEAVCVMPRRYPLDFRHAPGMKCHYAWIGMASSLGSEPLFYDGVNEKGLAGAALRFADSAVYHPADGAVDNVASFEVIPWILGQCATLEEARRLLFRIRVTDESYSEALPPSPLHWFFADKTGALVLESTAEGTRVYDDPPGVLTNEPPFPQQLAELARRKELPGDLSSPARFLRAAAAVKGTAKEAGKAAILRCFHMLDTVRQVRGLGEIRDGMPSATLYAAVCNMNRGIYCYETEENRTPTAVNLSAEDLAGSRPVLYPLLRSPQILWQNEKSEEND